MTQDIRREIIALLPRLRRFGRTLTRNQDEADDLVQATCERALARASQWQPGTQLDRWLFRVMRNLWIDDLRKRKLRVVDGDWDNALLTIPDGSSANPEQHQELAEVARAMQKLPDEQRELLGLVTVEGLSYSEAAELLAIPVGTVMSRLARGRKALSELLTDGATAPGAGQ